MRTGDQNAIMRRVSKSLQPISLSFPPTQTAALNNSATIPELFEAIGLRGFYGTGDLTTEGGTILHFAIPAEAGIQWAKAFGNLFHAVLAYPKTQRQSAKSCYPLDSGIRRNNE